MQLRVFFKKVWTNKKHCDIIYKSSGTTQRWPDGQAAKTTPSHGVNPGSIPGQVIKQLWIFQSCFFIILRGIIKNLCCRLFSVGSTSVSLILHSKKQAPHRYRYHRKNGCQHHTLGCKDLILIVPGSKGGRGTGSRHS